ncbi:MAG: hypothetical protein QHJ73_18920, partial [Armatimonadota bacterium]|nr:hypothetical protein [Armatimonadota bacterium]
VIAPGTAIRINAPDVVLDLDGHTVTFGTESAGQVFGIHIDAPGRVTVRNGAVVQGNGGGDYSVGVESRWRAHPAEVYGLSITVKNRNAYPMRFFGAAANVQVHHNHLASQVTEIESRHYPGNDLLRVDAKDGSIVLRENLLTGGCHRAITVSGQGAAVEVAHNDIRHEMLYTNGYALMCHAPGMRVHHNRVASVGRGVHLTAPDIQLYENYLDLKGHMELDDMPQKSRPFHQRRVELHGVKLEGDQVRRNRVFRNYVRITQPLPDNRWNYVPGTPLNLACYHPNAMNEIFDNVFIALTYYRTPRVGGYGDAGCWAAPLFFVEMTRGPADPGYYAARLRGNRFVSNDVFAASREPVNMTIVAEQNTFVLAEDPPPTVGHQAFRGIGAALETLLRGGGNRFVGMQP